MRAHSLVFSASREAILVCMALWCWSRPVSRGMSRFLVLFLLIGLARPRQEGGVVGGGAGPLRGRTATIWGGCGEDGSQRRRDWWIWGGGSAHEAEEAAKMAVLSCRLEDLLSLCFLPLQGMLQVAMWPEAEDINTFAWV